MSVSNSPAPQPSPPLLHVAFFEPQIPPNIGNAIRLAACTPVHLHLVEPLGFSLEDTQLRRAGLDYHDLAHVTVHPDLTHLFDALPDARTFAFTGRGDVVFTDVEYRAGDLLLFGREADGLPGLVVDRYGDLIVVEFFAAGMFRHREWIYEALREQFPGCRFHSFADEHVQKQESFDYRTSDPVPPAIITEYGIKFRADPAGAHKTGFFADQRENREWFSRQVAGKTVLDLCCNTGGFGVYAAVRGAAEVVGIDIDPALVTAKNSSFEQPAYLRKLDRTAAPPDPRKLRGV